MTTSSDDKSNAQDALALFIDYATSVRADGDKTVGAVLCRFAEAWMAERAAVRPPTTQPGDIARQYLRAEISAGRFAELLGLDMAERVLFKSLIGCDTVPPAAAQNEVVATAVMVGDVEVVGDEKYPLGLLLTFSNLDELTAALKARRLAFRSFGQDPAPLCATAATVPVWPKPSEMATKEGWQIDPAFLNLVQRAIEEADGPIVETLGLEEIEAVLLTIDLPGLPREASVRTERGDNNG